MPSPRSLFICLLFTLASFIAHGQSEKAIGPTGFRVSAGIGPGAVQPGMGLSGKLALTLLYDGWGGTVRGTIHDGQTGAMNSGWFGPPKEKYKEWAILGSHVLNTKGNVQFVASGGVSVLQGEVLSDDRLSLEPMPTKIGFGGELEAVYSMNITGISAGLITCINGHSNMIAFILSLTLSGMSN